MPEAEYRRLVVAIDGPSGVGKSSVSRLSASRLGLRYLDTGAQYRALTLWMLDHGVDLTDPRAITEHVGRARIVSGTDPEAPTITVDGADVHEAIRTARVDAAVSIVAAVPAVRQALIAYQREIIGDGGIIVEGRDISRVVAPHAQVRIYLTASPEVRAMRRHGERPGPPAARGAEGTVDATRGALERRDAADAKTTDVLDAPPGATVVDTSDMDRDQVINEVVALAEKRVDAPVGGA
jgi:cytidylate kinase